MVKSLILLIITTINMTIIIDILFFCLRVDVYVSTSNTVYIKVYRLGGETDSAIRWRKRTSCDVGERPEEAGC